MSEATWNLKKTVSYEMEVTLDKLPFGMEECEIDNNVEFDYDMSFGEYIKVELDRDDFRSRLHDYKKEVPTEAGITLYADEHCLIRSVEHFGEIHFELCIPVMDDWNESLMDEEIEVELY